MRGGQVPRRIWARNAAQGWAYLLLTIPSGGSCDAVAGAYLTAQAMVIPGEIVALDIWVLCATTVVLIAFACTGWTFSRRAGSLCVLAYAVYLAVQISTKSPSPVT